MRKSGWRTWGSSRHVSTTPWPATLPLAWPLIDFPITRIRRAPRIHALPSVVPCPACISVVRWTNELSILIDLAPTRHHPPILTPQSHRSSPPFSSSFTPCLPNRRDAAIRRFQDNVIVISMFQILIISLFTGIMGTHQSVID